MDNVKHQLSIHIDMPPPPGGLEIRYSYVYSSPHALREQVIRIARNEIEDETLEKIQDIISKLESIIPDPTPARLPHAEIVPKIRPAITTIVIQDQSARRTPLARMYYLEEIEELGSRIEQQVRMEKTISKVIH